MTGIDLTISTNLHTWIGGDKPSSSAIRISTNTDEIPNWVWDYVDADDCKSYSSTLRSGLTGSERRPASAGLLFCPLSGLDVREDLRDARW